MQTKIINDPELAALKISEGDVVGLPTETVYGLGANALNEEAVLKIFNKKERPLFNPLIVHIYDAEQAKRYASDIPKAAMDLMEKFSPGPITFVLKRKKVNEGKSPEIPLIVSSGMDSIALRIPSHNMFRNVLKLSGLAICAPSANRFGRISPVSSEDVYKELNGKIEYILDGGKCEVGIESTVVSFLNEVPEILRPGSITYEDIKKITGKVKIAKAGADLNSPGMLKDHYAPAKKMFLTEHLTDSVIEDLKEVNINGAGLKPGFLLLRKFENMNKAALNLFSEIRRLDEKDSSECDHIVAECVEDKGIGIAINDRLSKASSGTINKINGEWKVFQK